VVVGLRKKLELVMAVAVLTFPRAGRYIVQLWFYQEQGNDVLKGETPFSLVLEGH
jgi:hypothetical protein